MQHIVQAELVGIKHRSAAMGREAVAGQEDHVDIAGTLGDALFENPRAFVDQRIQRALQQALWIDVRLRVRRQFIEQFGEFEIGLRHARTIRVQVEAGPALLPEAPGGTQAVKQSGQALAGRQAGTLALTHALPDIQARHVEHGERPHGHAEFA
ncbi:hypothetical protein D3C85_1020120 [compost metagenome]